MDSMFNESDILAAATAHPATLKELETEIEELKKVNFNLKLRIFYLEERIAKLNLGGTEDIVNENVELKVSLEETTQELEERNRLLAKARATIQDLQQDLDHANRRGTDTAALEEALVHETKQVAEGYQTRIQELEQQSDHKILVQTQEIQQLTEINEELERELGELRGHFDTANSEVETLRVALEEKQRECALSDETARQQGKNAENAVMETESLQHAFDALQMEHAKAREEAERTKQELAKQLRKVVDMEKTLQEEARTHAQQLADRTMQVDHVQQNLSAARMEQSRALSQAQGRVEERNTLLRSLYQRIAENAMESGVQRDEDISAATKLLTSDNIISFQERVLQHLSAADFFRQQNKTNTTAVKKMVQSMDERWKHRFDLLTKKSEEKSAALVKLETHFAKLVAKAKSWRADKENSQKERLALQEAHSKSKDKILELTHKCKRYESKLQSVTQEQSALKDNKSELADKAQRTRKKLLDTQAELESALSKLAFSTQEKGALEKQLATVKRQLEDQAERFIKLERTFSSRAESNAEPVNELTDRVDRLAENNRLLILELEDRRRQGELRNREFSAVAQENKRLADERDRLLRAAKRHGLQTSPAVHKQRSALGDLAASNVPHAVHHRDSDGQRAVPRAPRADETVDNFVTRAQSELEAERAKYREIIAKSRAIGSPQSGGAGGGPSTSTPRSIPSRLL